MLRRVRFSQRLRWKLQANWQASKVDELSLLFPSCSLQNVRLWIYYITRFLFFIKQFHSLVRELLCFRVTSQHLHLKGQWPAGLNHLGKTSVFDSTLRLSVCERECGVSVYARVCVCASDHQFVLCSLFKPEARRKMQIRGGTSLSSSSSLFSLSTAFQSSRIEALTFASRHWHIWQLKFCMQFCLNTSIIRADHHSLFLSFQVFDATFKQFRNRSFLQNFPTGDCLLKALLYSHFRLLVISILRSND